MKALAAWFFAPAPATRLAAVRWLVLGFALIYLICATMPLLRPAFLESSAFKPVGAVSLLKRPLPPSVAVSLHVAAVAAGMTALTGAYYRVSGPIFALLLLWVTTYRNSWGMLFHTENLLVLHVAVLACCPQAADVWAFRRNGETPGEGESYGWPLRVLSVVTVSTYVISGIAKLHLAGPAWLGGDEIRSHIAFDAVRKIELGSLHSPLGAALVGVPWVFTPLAIITLAFELGAPLALFGRRCAWVWTITCWGFHAGVVLLMMIVFPYPLSGVAFASLFPVERVVVRAVNVVVTKLPATSRFAGLLRRHIPNSPIPNRPIPCPHVQS
jgi:hypothetical protein